jgi:hypothetical protein
MISQTGKTKGTYGAAKRLDQDPASVTVLVVARGACCLYGSGG